MATSFLKLKGFVQSYAGFDMDEISATDQVQLTDFVNDSIHVLKWEIEEEFNLLKAEERSHYIKLMQSQLTYLSNAITGFDKDKIKNNSLYLGRELALDGIYLLLEHLRIYFADQFNFNAELPDHFLERYKQIHPIFQRRLIEQLKPFNIGQELLLLLETFVEATERADIFKIRNWWQWEYLLNTGKILSEFIAKPPPGDIELELLKLFLHQDFNSIHVYAYFLKYFERITLSELTYPEQQQQLLYYVKIVKQVRVESPQRYDPNVQSLKTSVLDSLVAEIRYLEDKEKVMVQTFKSTTPGNPAKFYFKVIITLAELMFFFRIMLEVGFIQTKFNSYLYEFITNHIKTQRAENISKKSMRNHFSNKPFPDRLVQNVRSWLNKMINHIDLYYKT